MKKLEYIKPEMEVLDNELGFILCASPEIERGVTGEDTGGEDDYEGGDITPAGPGQKP